MESILTDRLATLSHPHRMAVFRLLMRRCPDELPAGEIVSVLGLKPSSASVYLSALTQTGLISQRREGTKLLYKINLAAAGEVVTGLFFDCCGGRADLCAPQLADLIQTAPLPTDKKLNVLFICSGNSARSILAEAILRDTASDRFNAYSAGTAHRSDLNPTAIDVLVANGFETTQLRSKSVTEFQGPDAPQMDFVFTVCDRAANEDCPTWQGQPIASHWGMPDPASVDGTITQKRLAFQNTFDALRNKIAAFTSLSFESLDRSALQKHVDEISKLTLSKD